MNFVSTFVKPQRVGKKMRRVVLTEDPVSVKRAYLFLTTIIKCYTYIQTISATLDSLGPDNQQVYFEEARVLCNAYILNAKMKMFKTKRNAASDKKYYCFRL